nr:MAG TPA: hypothetical protein [Caudoviricetes sp.]
MGYSGQWERFLSGFSQARRRNQHLQNRSDF